MHDVIILGGGPAGLAATTSCVHRGLETLLITKDFGGKTNLHLQLPFLDRHWTIPGTEVVDRLSGQVEYWDFARVLGDADHIGWEDQTYLVATKEAGSFRARSLILATGARPRRLAVPGERAYSMRGLCYSAASYAPLFQDRVVAVVGDGDLALRSALDLARFARRVFLILPERSRRNPALTAQVEAHPAIILRLGAQVLEVLGDEYARSLRLGGPEGEEEIGTDGVFVEYDLVPNSELVRGWVDLDPAGRIRIDFQNRTSRPGIFAAGDVTNTYREQVLIALGEGAKAALSAYEYLTTGEGARRAQGLPAPTPEGNGKSGRA